jgi:hypothetical protein
VPKVTRTRSRITKPKKTNNQPRSVIDRIGEDWGDEEGLKVNLYGRSGTGKTTFWSTFPEPILAILCSGSSKPGELKSIMTPANKKRVFPVACQSVDDFDQLVRHQDSTQQYNTVVLDHATGLQDFTLKEILGLDRIPEQLSWGLASQQQWGQIGIQMKERLRSILNLSCNIVIVAQEREFNMDTENSLISPYVASALSPSVVGWLLPACDYVVQTYIRRKITTKEMAVGKKKVSKQIDTGEVEFCLRTAPDPVYSTKFRIPKGANLPQCITDPDYNKLMGLIDSVT